MAQWAQAQAAELEFSDHQEEQSEFNTDAPLWPTYANETISIMKPGCFYIAILCFLERIYYFSMLQQGWINNISNN